MIDHFRHAHVIRITSHDDPNVWIDVLRIDIPFFQYLNKDLDSGETQGRVNVLHWGDGWDGLGPPADRVTSSLPVVNPANPSQSINIDIIEQMRLISQGQGVLHVFKNGPDNNARTVRVINVYHTDVSSLDMSHPVSWETYSHVLAAGAQDTSQSLSVELPKHFNRLFQGDYSGEQGIGRNSVFQNEAVFDAVTQGQQGDYNP